MTGGARFLDPTLLLDLGPLTAYTAPDLSGKGHAATLVRGLYASTDGSQGRAIQADCSAEGSGTYRITGRGRAGATLDYTLQISDTVGAFGSFFSDDFENFTSPSMTGVPSNVVLGCRGDTASYTSADWSEIRLQKQVGAEWVTVAHWPLIEAQGTFGSLEGVVCFDASGGGYHGTHSVGVQAGGPESGPLQTMGLDYNQLMWFDGNYVTAQNIVIGGTSDWTLDFSIMRVDNAADFAIFGDIYDGFNFNPSIGTDSCAVQFWRNSVYSASAGFELKIGKLYNLRLSVLGGSAATLTDTDTGGTLTTFTIAGSGDMSDLRLGFARSRWAKGLLFDLKFDVNGDGHVDHHYRGYGAEDWQDQITGSDSASREPIRTFCGWVYHDGTYRVLASWSGSSQADTVEIIGGRIETFGFEPAQYATGDSQTPVSSFSNLFSGTLKQGWNFVAFTTSGYSPAADTRYYERMGHLKEFSEVKTQAQLEAIRAAEAAQYPAPAIPPVGFWAPSDLYAHGEEGAFYDFTDETSLFVETTGASATTAASIDDVVGTVASVSGDGSYLTAPSNAARPLRKSWGLLNDKIDDRMLADLTFTDRRPVNVIIVTPDYVAVLTDQEYQTMVHEIPRADLVAWGCIDRYLTTAEIEAIGNKYRVAVKGRWDGYFAYRNNSTVGLSVVTDGGATWNVDWGDRTSETGLASSASTVSHTYAAARSGIVLFRSAAAITELRLFNSGVTYGLGVADLPSGLTHVEIRGSNTLTGDVSGLPSGATYVDIRGSNTLTGDVSGLPSGLTFVNIQGSNSLTGDVSGLPSEAYFLIITGFSTLTATTTSFWVTGVGIQWIGFQSDLTTAHVDNLLIAASGHANWIVYRRIDLATGNSPRSSASDAAVATLQANGVTVLTA